MEIIIIIAIIAAVGGYFIITYNSLVSLKNTVEEAFATMDVYLKKRWDLIPNLVETVKGYAAHEKSAFTEIVQLRNMSYGSMSIDEKTEVNNQLSKSIPKLLAVAEAYPELQASANFQDLSQQLGSVENDIANARKYYNGTVKIFNNKVQMFPSCLVARILGYGTRKMFEANEAERENVRVQF